MKTDLFGSNFVGKFTCRRRRGRILLQALPGPDRLKFANE